MRRELTRPAQRPSGSVACKREATVAKARTVRGNHAALDWETQPGVEARGQGDVTL